MSDTKGVNATREELRGLRSYRNKLVYFDAYSAKTQKERDVIAKNIQMASARIRSLEERQKEAAEWQSFHPAEGAAP